MNLTRIIGIKERIAILDALKPDERHFVLECITESVARRRQPGRMLRVEARVLAPRLAEHPGVFPADAVNVIDALYDRGYAIVTGNRESQDG